jgi:hypothetical protein
MAHFPANISKINIPIFIKQLLTVFIDSKVRPNVQLQVRIIILCKPQLDITLKYKVTYF